MPGTCILTVPRRTPSFFPSAGREGENQALVRVTLGFHPDGCGCYGDVRMSGTSLVWFRLDLRLADNPALQAAVQRGGPVVPVFIWAPDEEAPWAPGGASRWWLHHSLQALDASLRARGSRLIIRQAPVVTTLLLLAKECGATAVYWNRRYEPGVIARDLQTSTGLQNAGLAAESFNGALLHEPWTIQNKSGKPFQVFTPFWKHCMAQREPGPPLVTRSKWKTPKSWPASLEIAKLGLQPRPDWAGGLQEMWQPGEAGAGLRLKRFLASAASRYTEDRNRPDRAGTSQLSPHLHFGEISPRQIWHALSAKERSSQFLVEIGWREFAHHLLFHFPQTPSEPLRAEFKKFRWRQDAAFLEAWQKGRTGYPIVDAGMRQLWTTGWMHNRLRMVVASFLVKDLLLSWTEGAAWFWDTLVDADLAQNTLGWQWTAGCGADAAPYFRVFNPVSQGEKFDPDGDYVREWCPELASLPNEWLHRPWEAPTEICERAGFLLERDYPSPVVSHAIAREVALETFQQIRRSPK